MQSCVSNTGAFGNTPALNGPVGIDVKGSQVWISQTSPAGVRVCDWYSRQLTGCSTTSSLGANGLPGIAQVALADDKSRAYVAVSNPTSAIVYCNNTQTMTDCDTIEVSDNPIGVDVGLGQVWYGGSTGVTRCPLTDGVVDNTTCITTGLGGQVNGVWLDSYASKLYLSQTAMSKVLVCDIDGLAVINCVSTNIPKGPGSVGLDTFLGRLYVPLSTAGSNELTVCDDAAQSCATSIYTLNPPRTSTGNQNIAHAPAPDVSPGVVPVAGQQ